MLKGGGKMFREDAEELVDGDRWRSECPLKKRKRGENVPKGKGCWIGQIGKEESR